MQTIHPKVAAGAFAGALSILALGTLNRYTGFHASPDEAASITTVFGFAVAWLVPERLWTRAEDLGIGELPAPEAPPTTPTDVPAAQAIPAPVVDPAPAPVVSP